MAIGDPIPEAAHSRQGDTFSRDPRYPSAASLAFEQDHEEKRVEAQGNAAPTQDKVWEFAKKQSQERRDLAKKHAEARVAAKDDPAQLETLHKAHIEEKAALNEKHDKERKDFDPRGQLRMPVFNGLAIQDAVADLHAELTELAPESNFEVSELRNFGLEFDVFDPVTGMVISPARAHRRDVGDAGALMTAGSVVSDIAAARAHQMTAGVTQYSADRTL